MKISYIRASTKDQNPELQVKALNNFECEKLFSEQISGGTAKRLK